MTGGAARTLMLTSLATVFAQWTTNQPMPQPRQKFGLGVTGSGAIFVGGTGGSGATPISSDTVAAQYNVAADAWAYLNSMPTGRVELGVGVDATGAALHAVGGFATSQLAAVEKYTLIQDRWTTARPMPVAKSAFSFCVIGDVAIAVGGSPFQLSYTADTHALALPSGAWTTVHRSPTARRSMAAASTTAGKMYVIGGTGGTGTGTSGTDLQTVESYTAATDAWSSASAVPGVRVSSAAGFYGDDLYVLGGTSSASPTGNQLAFVHAYSLSSSRWTTSVPMPTARSLLMAAIARGSNARLYALGGTGSGSFTIGAYSESRALPYGSSPA